MTEDRIPARFSDGEFVARAAVTHRMIPSLDSRYTACCGRLPAELPDDDRITATVSATTCQPGKVIA